MDDFSTSGYAPRRRARASEVADAARPGHVPRRDRARLHDGRRAHRPGPVAGHRVHPLPRRLRRCCSRRPSAASASASARSRSAGCTAIALLLGLGIGPTIGYFLENDGTVITQAAGCTALITLGMGAGGFAMSKDLAAWMRPLSFLILGLVVVSFAMLIFSSGGNPILSAAIGDRLGAADHGRLQLPAQARHEGRRGLARDRHLRLDREHLPVAAEHLRQLVARAATLGGCADGR